MLSQHVQLVEMLQSFKNEHGTTFVHIRDFYNTMLNADSETLPEEVRTFRDDWYTVDERPHRDRDRYLERYCADTAQRATGDHKPD